MPDEEIVDKKSKPRLSRLHGILVAAKLRFVRLWHWSAKWNWFSILVSGALGSMPRLGEYVVSILLLLIATLGLVSKISHSGGMDGVEPWERRTVKTSGVILAITVFSYMIAVTTLNASKDHSWSNLPRLMAYFRDVPTEKGDKALAPTEAQKAEPAAKLPGPQPAAPNRGPNKTPLQSQLRPPQNRALSTESLPKITVKFVNSTVRDTIGEISFARVRIELEAESAMQVIERQGIAIDPVDSDPTKQSALENSLWAQVANIKDVVPFQIRPHDETVVLAVETDPLTAPQQSALRVGSQFYFLLYVTDLKGRPLLEFCLHKGLVGDAYYCRSHNGP
jgi:hypothetical protein